MQGILLTSMAGTLITALIIVGTIALFIGGLVLLHNRDKKRDELLQKKGKE